MRLRFSREYHMEIPESLPTRTPLLNLDMLVTDTDFVSCHHQDVNDEPLHILYPTVRNVVIPGAYSTTPMQATDWLYQKSKTSNRDQRLNVSPKESLCEGYFLKHKHFCLTRKYWSRVGIELKTSGSVVRFVNH